MPRDGSNIYHRPAGTDAVTDTTIESAKYNSYVADVEQDLNLARPIVAGGTGGTSASQALFNLGAEVSTQVVTNYDSFLFQPGSFYSAAGATNPPVAGHAFVGICYSSDTPAQPPANLNLIVEARDQNDTVVPGRLYVREKKAGVWSAWVVGYDATAADARFVNVTGDTMTSTLNLAMPSFGPQLILKNTTTTQQKMIRMGGSGTSNNLEIVNNANTNVIFSLDDTGLGTFTAGGVFNGQLTVNGGNIISQVSATVGTVSFGAVGNNNYLNYNGTGFTLNGGNLFVNSPSVTAGVGGATGSYLFGNSGTKSLQFDGTLFALTGGVLVVNSSVFAANTATTGFFQFGTSGTKHLQYDGTNFSLTGGGLTVISGNFNISSGTGFVSGNFESGGNVKAIGYNTRVGTTGAYGANLFVFNWVSGTGATLYIDNTSMGLYSSDYRIKKDVLPLPGMWDTVKGLRPIKYTHKDFTPSSEREAVKKTGEPFFKGDNVERWGFVAHELQETLIENAASSKKDAADAIQSPNPWTVIAALTRALQEAMVRIEVLEAGAGGSVITPRRRSLFSRE